MGLNNISLQFIMVLIAQSSHLLRQGLLEVPTEWVFEDEGFSGATLERPVLSVYETSPRKAKSWLRNVEPR
jgi:hypothetical protein